MRAATLFVAVLCATLPVVHGRERLKTSENDPSRPDKDGTSPEKLEDPKTTEPTKRASSFCYGYQHRLLPPTSGPRQICAIVFRPNGDGECEAVPELFIPKSKKVSSSGVKCLKSKSNLRAVCYCGGRKCNADTKAISRALTTLVKNNENEIPWLKNCPKALDQLENTPNADKEETPTTGKPKQDKTTNPPKPASIPKDQSRAESTSDAPSAPEMTTAADSSTHTSTAALGSTEKEEIPPVATDPSMPTTVPKENPVGTESTQSDDLTASTNSTAATSPSLLQQPKCEGSSIVFGWLIGSIVFNVLTVATIIAMAIVIIKMKKGSGKGKGEVKKVAPPPIMEIKIENPAKKKVPSVAPATTEPKETKVDQGEAAADTTMLATAQDDLDTTGSSTISDTTGTTYQSQVNFTVSGFKQS